MATRSVSPKGPYCPETGRYVSVLDLYGVLYDVERRIHVVRTLIGRLDPGIALVYGKKKTAKQWRKPSAAAKLGSATCNHCRDPLQWPE